MSVAVSVPLLGDLAALSDPCQRAKIVDSRWDLTRVFHWAVTRLTAY